MKTEPTLADYLAYARVVCAALPIDEDADRRAEEMLARYLARQPKRKLAAKAVQR